MQPAYQPRSRSQQPAARRPHTGAGRPGARPQGTPSGVRRPNSAAVRSPAQRQQVRRMQQQARRRKMLRRRNFLLMAGGGLLVLAVAVVLAVKFFTGEKPAAVTPAAPSAALTAQPGGVAVSLPALDLPAVADGPYNEPGMPLLFNYNHPIPAEYTSALLSGGMAEIGNGQQMEKKAAEAYLAMSAAAKEDGVSLVPLSGYRSNERQKNNYESSINRYLAQGYTTNDAKSRTEGYYAIPGTSEHEAGLALDIGDAAVPGANIQESFEQTKAFAWLQEHCTQYGFILRYPAEEFDITHIHYEPWHYRYVGSNHAAIITERGITLEEYVGAQ